jgi:predicted dehydrogenase
MTVRPAAALVPGATLFSDYEAFLAHGLDLVEILTPHPVHAEQAIKALAAGSHVSVQKPMAISLEQADAMLAAAKRHGRKLAVFETYIRYPPLMQAKALIEQGAIGRPLHMRLRTLAGDPGRAWPVPAATWRWRAELFEQHGLGRLTFDDGHHRLATALDLFGPVRDVCATIDTTATPHGPIDAPASIIWRHAEPPVHVIWDVIYAPQMRIRSRYYALDERFEITGETGVLCVHRAAGRMLDEPVLTVQREGRVSAYHDLEDDWGASFEATTRALVDALLDDHVLPFDGDRGREVLRLALAIRDSARLDRTIALQDRRAAS